MINGGRGATGVVGTVAGSTIWTTSSWLLLLIVAANAWLSAVAAAAAAFGSLLVAEIWRIPVPAVVDALTTGVQRVAQHLSGEVLGRRGVDDRGVRREERGEVVGGDKSLAFLHVRRHRERRGRLVLLGPRVGDHGRDDHRYNRHEDHRQLSLPCDGDDLFELH